MGKGVGHKAYSARLQAYGLLHTALDIGCRAVGIWLENGNIGQGVRLRALGFGLRAWSLELEAQGIRESAEGIRCRTGAIWHRA